MDKISNTP